MSEYPGPKYHELMNPLLKALRELGGSASNEELTQKVAEVMELPDEQVGVLHNPDTGSMTELA